MAKEGIPFILIFLLPAVVLLFFGLWVGAIICLPFAAFMAFFFRDPHRECVADDTVVISPADGRVLVVAPVEPGSDESPTQISIFLSPMDVHINRSPIAGKITDVIYKPGAFHIASKQIASVENEQNVVTIEGRLIRIMFRQIAGTVARRIVLWKREGDVVGMGEKVGLMKFSSRMDVVVPPEVEVVIAVGDRVVGGVTVIGRLRASAKAQEPLVAGR